MNLDCSTEVAASLFLALHVLEAWLTILMFPSVTCLNKLLSLVQSCLQRDRDRVTPCSVMLVSHLRNTDISTVIVKMKRTGM